MPEAVMVAECSICGKVKEGPVSQGPVKQTIPGRMVVRAGESSRPLLFVATA